MPRISRASCIVTAVALGSARGQQHACTFTAANITCVTIGQPCLANTGGYACDGRPLGSSDLYSPAFCLVTNPGTGSGLVQTGPTFEAAYGASCVLSSPTGCQYVDPLFSGEERFPQQLSCEAESGKGVCRLVSTQMTGDPCAVNSECVSGTCSRAGVCAGAGNGQACVEGGCASGLFCSDIVNTVGVCKPVVSRGGYCSDSVQCPPGQMCNYNGAPPTCTDVFSLPGGVATSYPDLCASGLTDAAGKCVGSLDYTQVGMPCDGSLPPSALPSGFSCFCASDGQYRLEVRSQRSPAVVKAWKDAWACLATATAPDGTPCANPFAVTPRVSDVGSCAYLRCHPQLLEFFAARKEMQQPPYSYFDRNPPCVQSIFSAMSDAAAGNYITCALPAVWAAFGWHCDQSAPPSQAPTGLSPGAAFGISVLVIAMVAAAGAGLFRWRTGEWPQLPASVTQYIPSFSWARSGSSSYKAVGSTSLVSSSSVYGSA